MAPRLPRPQPRRPTSLRGVGLCGLAAAAVISNHAPARDRAVAHVYGPPVAAPPAAARPQLWAQFLQTPVEVRKPGRHYETGRKSPPNGAAATMVAPSPMYPVPHEAEESENLICSKHVDPMKLAMVISARVRSHGLATVQAVGDRAVSRAMRAIISAGRFVGLGGADGGDVLAVVPSFTKMPVSERAGGGEWFAMTLSVRPMAAVTATASEEEWITTTGDDEKLPCLAGTIKARLAEKGVARVTAAGPARVYRAMKSLTRVADFLEQDGGGGTVACTPSWDRTKPGGGGDYARMAFDCVMQSAFTRPLESPVQNQTVMQTA